LVVFASQRSGVPGANLHTSFSLNVSGGISAFSTRIPRRACPGIRTFIPEQGTIFPTAWIPPTRLNVFRHATPGGPNGDSAITADRIADPFQRQSRLFQAAFNLFSVHDPGATILYTPRQRAEASPAASPTDGLCRPIYINKRRRCGRRGFVPNFAAHAGRSQSYFFVEDIILQPNNPGRVPDGQRFGHRTPGFRAKTGSQSYYQMNPAVFLTPSTRMTFAAGLLSNRQCPSFCRSRPVRSGHGIYTHSAEPWTRLRSYRWNWSFRTVPGRHPDCGLQIQGGTQRDPGQERSPERLKTFVRVNL